MAQEANAVVEQIETNWVGAQVTEIGTHCGSQRIHLTAKGLDNEILYEWLPSLGWEVVGVDPSEGGALLDVMLMEA